MLRHITLGTALVAALLVPIGAFAGHSGGGGHGGGGGAHGGGGGHAGFSGGGGHPPPLAAVAGMPPLAAALHISAMVVVNTPALVAGAQTSVEPASEADTSWLDEQPVHTLRVDTGVISGTANGGIMVSARAGYGRTITASTCGSAAEIFRDFARRRVGGQAPCHAKLIRTVRVRGTAAVIETTRNRHSILKSGITVISTLPAARRGPLGHARPP